MDITEIKHEFESDNSLQCRACLSVGRKLTALGRFTNIYMKLTSELDHFNLSSTNPLEICWECRSLLRKVLLFQEQVKKASELLFIGQAKTELVKKEIKNKSKSRWALKWAQQNKKPKFKIVATNLDDTFKKVQISNEELAECMARERDSEYYKSKRFKCDQCVLGFVEENDLKNHNEIVHTKIAGRFICNVCETSFENKRHLSAHITQHYLVHKCMECQFVCRSVGQRPWHFEREHKKMFQCLKCELKFSNRRTFFRHFKEWHEKFVCDHCGISFKMRYCIKDHIRKQHSPFTCTPCNKTFARYNGLWLHNKLAHSPAAAPAYCVECDTTYKDVYRYKWHLCNSAKHKPKKKLSIPCPDCEKTFTKKIYMSDHHKLVHLKLFRFKCEQCNKNFIRNAELVKHRLRTHEGILPPKNKICYICGRGFSTNKILLNHMRTHTDERGEKTPTEDEVKNPSPTFRL